MEHQDGINRLTEAFQNEICQVLFAFSFNSDDAFNEVNNLGLGFFKRKFKHLLDTAFDETSEVANFMYIYIKLLQVNNLNLFYVIRKQFPAEVAVYLDSKWKVVCEKAKIQYYDTYGLPDITPERRALMYVIQEFYDTPPLPDKRPLYRKGGQGFHETMDAIADLAKDNVEKR